MNFFRLFNDDCSHSLMHKKIKFVYDLDNVCEKYKELLVLDSKEYFRKFNKNISHENFFFKNIKLICLT